MNRIVNCTSPCKRNFTQVPNWIIEGMGELSPLAFRVYLVLFEYKTYSDCHPTIGWIAKKIRNKGHAVGNETIKRAIAELKQSGWLEIRSTGFNTYNYCLYDRPYHKTTDTNEEV